MTDVRIYETKDGRFLIYDAYGRLLATCNTKKQAFEFIAAKHLKETRSR